MHAFKSKEKVLNSRIARSHYASDEHVEESLSRLHQRPLKDQPLLGTKRETEKAAFVIRL